jgi:hypothetical protein
MKEQLDRYARATAGAAFVVIWMTLGFTAAALAAVAALAAAEAPRPRRARRPRRRPELPLVPDEPSLVVTLADL